MIRVFKSAREWIEFRDSAALAGKSVGFVPTMGALHAGHAALVERSVRENDATLVSIFVNPTQFNDPKDLEKYPRTLGADLELCAQAWLAGGGAPREIYVLNPEYEELYSDRYRYRVSENDFSKVLCGAFRPGHFDGVLTVVMKLLNIAGARRAYFGEKDYQQLVLVRDMAETFFMKTEIVPCSTVRREDGLALSSRNARLSPEESALAPRLAEALRAAPSLEAAKGELAKLGFEVEYLEEHLGRRFIAARLGNVRLIDNVQI